MSVEYFEQHRREMVAAIKVIAEHLAAEVGKTALEDRVLIPEVFLRDAPGPRLPHVLASPRIR